MILKDNIIKAEQRGDEISVALQLRVLSHSLSPSCPESRACSESWHVNTGGASPGKQE